MVTIKDALKTAMEYYDLETYYHALRVAGYVAGNPSIPDSMKDDCITLAIMHDLAEDTEWSISDLNHDEYMKKNLELLTKPKDKDYSEYLNDIKKHSATKPEAYWVKMADMKDHLSQKETLTDKLKEKYLNALPYLL